MEFGLGGFVEMIDKYYGARAAKLATALIAVLGMFIMLGIAGQFAVAPFMSSIIVPLIDWIQVDERTRSVFIFIATIVSSTIVSSIVVYGVVIFINNTWESTAKQLLLEVKSRHRSGLVVFNSATRVIRSADLFDRYSNMLFAGALPDEISDELLVRLEQFAFVLEQSEERSAEAEGVDKSRPFRYRAAEQLLGLRDRSSVAKP